MNNDLAQAIADVARECWRRMLIECGLSPRLRIPPAGRTLWFEVLPLDNTVTWAVQTDRTALFRLAMGAFSTFTHWPGEILSHKHKLRHLLQRCQFCQHIYDHKRLTGVNQ